MPGNSHCLDCVCVCMCVWRIYMWLSVLTELLPGKTRGGAQSTQSRLISDVYIRHISSSQSSTGTAAILRRCRRAFRYRHMKGGRLQACSNQLLQFYDVGTLAFL